MAGSRGTLSVPTFDFPLLCYTVATTGLRLGTTGMPILVFPVSVLFETRILLQWTENSNIESHSTLLIQDNWTTGSEAVLLKKLTWRHIYVTGKANSNPWDLGTYVKNPACRITATIYEILLVCTMNPDIYSDWCWPWVFLSRQRSLLLCSWIGLNHAMRSKKYSLICIYMVMSFSSTFS